MYEPPSHGAADGLAALQAVVPGRSPCNPAAELATRKSPAAELATLQLFPAEEKSGRVLPVLGLCRVEPRLSGRRFRLPSEVYAPMG